MVGRIQHLSLGIHRHVGCWKMFPRLAEYRGLPPTPTLSSSALYFLLLATKVYNNRDRKSDSPLLNWCSLPCQHHFLLHQKRTKKKILQTTRKTSYPSLIIKIFTFFPTLEKAHQSANGPVIAPISQCRALKPCKSIRSARILHFRNTTAELWKLSFQNHFTTTHYFESWNNWCCAKELSRFLKKVVRWGFSINLSIFRFYSDFPTVQLIEIPISLK